MDKLIEFFSSFFSPNSQYPPIKLNRNKNTIIFLLQKSCWSGDRGKGNCVLFSTVATTNGTVLAVQPGPQISASPRGGDGLAMGAMLDVAEADEHQTGWTKMFLGTSTRFCAKIKNTLIHLGKSSL